MNLTGLFPTIDDGVTVEYYRELSSAGRGRSIAGPINSGAILESAIAVERAQARQ